MNFYLGSLFPSSYKQSDTSSKATDEASHKRLGSDYMGAYKLDSVTHVAHSSIYGHTRNMKCDHKLPPKRRDK